METAVTMFYFILFFENVFVNIFLKVYLIHILVP